MPACQWITKFLPFPALTQIGSLSYSLCQHTPGRKRYRNALLHSTESAVRNRSAVAATLFRKTRFGSAFGMNAVLKARLKKVALSWVHCLSTTTVENAIPCTITDARYEPRDSIYIMGIAVYQATHFSPDHNYILSTCRRLPECPPECPHMPVLHLPTTQAANILMVRQGNTKVTRRPDPQLRRRPSAKCLRVFRCRISPTSHQKIDSNFHCQNGTPSGDLDLLGP